MKEKENIKNWIKTHKKELIIAGFTVSSLLLIIAGLKNRGELEKLFCTMQEVTKSNKKSTPTISCANETVENIVSIEPYLNNTKAPHHVEGHLMKLASGKNVSEEMLEFVKENNIHLPPNYTFRRAYETGVV